MKLIPEEPVGRWLRRPLKIVAALLTFPALVFALLVDLVYLGDQWTVQPGLERKRWLADYQKIKKTLEQSYPNLDWTLEKGEPNLPLLDRVARAAIEKAATRAEADEAMQRFVDTFKDGHLDLRPPRVPRWETFKLTLNVDALSRHTPPREACAVLGYDGGRAYTLPFDFTGPGVAPFHRLSDANAFAAGILDLDRPSRRVGIVRIASFDTDDYQRTCRDEWSRLRLSLETTCERECVGQFRTAVRNRLLLQLESRIRQFRRAGVDLVALDLTDNPGGHGWYKPIGEILAGRVLPVPPAAFPRDRDTVAELDDYLARLDRSLALCPLDPARRREVEQSYRRYDAARTEALAPCDRSGIWTTDDAHDACSQLTSALPDDRQTLASLSLRSSLDHRFRDDLLEPAVYRAPRVSWGGPLAVLVDRDTASAAEILAGILQDWAGATVIGEHSYSCGGGWHRGDRPFGLVYSDLELHVPDEVKYRRDGSNYRAGIEPDLLTGWGPDQSEAERARWLIEALREVLAMGSH